MSKMGRKIVDDMERGITRYLCLHCGQGFTSDEVMMAYSSSVVCCPHCGIDDYEEIEGVSNGSK